MKRLKEIAKKNPIKVSIKSKKSSQRSPRKNKSSLDNVKTRTILPELASEAYGSIKPQKNFS